MPPRKPCKRTQIRNPVSKRCVSRRGKVGRLIIAGRQEVGGVTTRSGRGRTGRRQFVDRLRRDNKRMLPGQRWAKKPGDPGFRAFVEAKLAREIPRPVTSCTSTVQLFAHQRCIDVLTQRGSTVDRLAVIHRTGSGKTISMLAILNNLYDDPRFKLCVFPSQKIVDEFYSEMLKIKKGNKYYKYLARKMTKQEIKDIVDFYGGNPPSQAGARRARARAAREKMIKLLEMSRRLRVAGKPGELRAPLRVFTYGAFAGSQARAGKSSMFRLRGGYTNPYSNRIVIMDEAHVLQAGVERFSAATLANMKKMVPLLKKAKNTKLFAFTATPIINKAQQGRALLDLVKGEEHRGKPDGHFISYFASKPAGVYAALDASNDPEAAENLTTSNVFLVRSVKLPVSTEGKKKDKMLVAGNKYMASKPTRISESTPVKALLRLQKFCNHFNGVFSRHVKPKIMADVFKERAPKLWELAKDLRRQSGKCLVMTNNTTTQKTFAEILRKCLQCQKACDATKSKRACVVSILKGAKNIDSEGRKIKPKDELEIFNSAANKEGDIIKCMVVDSKDYTEGVSFKAVRRFFIVNPAIDWATHMQIVGRILRMCSHTVLPAEKRKAQFTLYCATLPGDRQTADEVVLAKVRREGVKVGTMTREMFADRAIDASFMQRAYPRARRSSLAAERQRPTIKLERPAGVKRRPPPRPSVKKKKNMSQTDARRRRFMAGVKKRRAERLRRARGM